LESCNAEERKRAKKRYVDLCNEQLFYLWAKCLPDEVADEWLDGMIAFLPLLNGETGEAHPESRTKLIEPKMLWSYPRNQSAFTVDEPDDLDLKSERIALIQQIKKNVGNKPGWLRSHFMGRGWPVTVRRGQGHR
jgi:hypothetical protein